MAPFPQLVRAASRYLRGGARKTMRRVAMEGTELARAQVTDAVQRCVLKRRCLESTIELGRAVDTEKFSVKDKACKEYEFGNKVSLAVTCRGSWIVGTMSWGNPYDGHTLGKQLT